MEDGFAFCKYIKDYFEELSACVLKLSHGNEGLLSKLPHWYIQYGIRMIYFQEVDFIYLYVNPNVADRTSIMWSVSSRDKFKQIIKQINDFLKIGNGSPGMMTQVVTAEQYPVIGQLEFGIAGMVTNCSQDELTSFSNGFSYNAQTSKFFSDFSLEKARETAIKDWQNVIRGATYLQTNRYDFDIKKTVDVFESIIYNSKFVERKVHRFLFQYAMIFLPAHKTCYFEKSFFDESENETIADFVLEREVGLPALLIELESPHIKIYKKDGELRFEANHAKNQISQWVKAIERNPKNLEAGFDFLAGRKARLVIGGRGLYYIDDMKKSNSDDTTIWTYSLLINETKIRWNKYFEEQYKMAGIDRSLPFKL